MSYTEHGGARRAAVFLDRDGTVMADRHYLGDPDGVELLPGAAEAILRLNRAALPVILVTNQSGIGRGLFTHADFQSVQSRLIELLAQKGARLDGVYHCPHAPDDALPCTCRKPRLGLFLQAAAEHEIDLRNSFFVGDRIRDVEPAAAFDAKGFLVGSRESRAPGEEVRVEISGGTRSVPSLDHAVDHILREHSSD
ncbi:HAD family hydrolase [soil metagenome]